MSATHVRRVTLTVEMDNGDSYTRVVDKPSPSGGNPRFIGQQANTAIAQLVAWAEKVAVIYGNQIPGESVAHRWGREAAEAMNRALASSR